MSLEVAPVSVAAVTGEQYPAPIGADTFLATPKPLQPALIELLIRLGEMAILAAASKSFKTWIAMQLGLCVASGIDFLGRACLASRVLLVNTELQEATLHFRLHQVKTALESAGAKVDLAAFDIWNLRNSKIGTGFGGELKKICEDTGVGLVIIDPLYPLLGGRNENDNGEIAELLSEVRAYCETAGAASLVIHHFAKGNAASKDAIDRASGAGSIARFADSMLSLSHHEKAGQLVLEGSLRSFPPMESEVLRWDYPLLTVAAGEDASALKGGRPRRRPPASMLIDLLTPGMNKSQLAKAAATAGVSNYSTARKIVEEGLSMGLWELKDDGLFPCTPSTKKVSFSAGGSL
jgi:hypothetical protein